METKERFNGQTKLLDNKALQGALKRVMSDECSSDATDYNDGYDDKYTDYNERYQDTWPK